jgi:hypothetical protein
MRTSATQRRGLSRIKWRGGLVEAKATAPKEPDQTFAQPFRSHAKPLVGPDSTQQTINCLLEIYMLFSNEMEPDKCQP